jgi:hypothetical protein
VFGLIPSAPPVFLAHYGKVGFVFYDKALRLRRCYFTAQAPLNNAIYYFFSRETIMGTKRISSIRKFLLHNTPPCDEITAIASKALDVRLSFSERMRLRLHFLVCAACKHFDEQIHLLNPMLKSALRDEWNAPVSSNGDGASASPLQQAYLSPEAKYKMQQTIEAKLRQSGS